MSTLPLNHIFIHCTQSILWEIYKCSYFNMTHLVLFFCFDRFQRCWNDWCKCRRTSLRRTHIFVGLRKQPSPTCPGNRCRRPSGATRRANMNAKGMSEPPAEPLPKTAKTGRRMEMKEQSLSASPISCKLWGWSWEKCPEMGNHSVFCLFLDCYGLYFHPFKIFFPMSNKGLEPLMFNFWQAVGDIPMTICWCLLLWFFFCFFFRNCLFRALGDQLEGHSRGHLRLRQETIQYMMTHRQDFEPFVEDDVPFSQHCKNIIQPFTTGKVIL